MRFDKGELQNTGSERCLTAMSIRPFDREFFYTIWHLQLSFAKNCYIRQNRFQATNAYRNSLAFIIFTYHLKLLMVSITMSRRFKSSIFYVVLLPGWDFVSKHIMLTLCCESNILVLSRIFFFFSYAADVGLFVETGKDLTRAVFTESVFLGSD